MSDKSNQPNYEQYWPRPTFSVLGVDQGYIVEQNIYTAEEVLVRWGSFEPYELALGINDHILRGKTDEICTFPQPFFVVQNAL